MEEIDTALNTYRVLILNEDPYDVQGDMYSVAFFVDVSNYPYIDHESRIKAAEITMEVLADNEHYEKCVDLRDYIKELKDEVQRLSTKNN